MLNAGQAEAWPLACCSTHSRVPADRHIQAGTFFPAKLRACKCFALSLKQELVLLVGCLKPQQHASVSQGWICSHKFTCCHADTDVADQTLYLIQPQYTDSEPTGPSADPIIPGAWQGSQRSDNFEITGMTRPGKFPMENVGIERWSAAAEANTFTTRPVRRSKAGTQAGTRLFWQRNYMERTQNKTCKPALKYSNRFT